MDPVPSGVFPPPRGGADPLSPVAVEGSIFLELVPDRVWQVEPLVGRLEGRRGCLRVRRRPVPESEVPAQRVINFCGRITGVSIEP
jgi:hypothetical protein